MPILSTCCRFASLQTGCKIIAIGSLIIFGLAVATTLIQPNVHPTEKDVSDPFHLEEPFIPRGIQVMEGNDQDNGTFVMVDEKNGSPTLIIAYIFNILMCSILLYGAIKEHETAILVFAVSCWMEVMARIFVIIMFTIKVDGEVVIAVLFCESIGIYFGLITVSYYQELRAKRQRVPVGNQLSIAGNVEANIQPSVYYKAYPIPHGDNPPTYVELYAEGNNGISTVRSSEKSNIPV